MTDPLMGNALPLHASLRNRPLDNARMPLHWTTADFDTLSWNDCHVHGMRIGSVKEERGTSELQFDIDFIVEWISLDSGGIQFRVAPATLTFHDVFALRVELDFKKSAAGMCPFSIDGLERTPLSYPTGHLSYRWRLPINWQAGEITFDSPGFTQVLNREPIASESQSLTTAQR